VAEGEYFADAHPGGERDCNDVVQVAVGSSAAGDAAEVRMCDAQEVPSLRDREDLDLLRLARRRSDVRHRVFAHGVVSDRQPEETVQHVAGAGGREAGVLDRGEGLLDQRDRHLVQPDIAEDRVDDAADLGVVAGQALRLQWSAGHATAHILEPLAPVARAMTDSP